MMRVAELESLRRSQNGQSLEPLFREIFFQLLQTESLNYHYALCFIFIKYQKEKDSIRELIVEVVTKQLQKEGQNKNSRNLILCLSLFLKSLDSLILSQPIRYKVKQLVKNIDLLTNKLEINQLFSSQPKEYINTRRDSI